MAVGPACVAPAYVAGEGPPSRRSGPPFQALRAALGPRLPIACSHHSLFLADAQTHLEWVTFNGVRKTHTVREKSQVRSGCFLPGGRVIFSPLAPTPKCTQKSSFYV